jgi:hypothetical protein
MSESVADYMFSRLARERDPKRAQPRGAAVPSQITLEEARSFAAAIRYAESAQRSITGRSSARKVSEGSAGS